MKVLQCFRRSGTTLSVIQCHISEDVSLQFDEFISFVCLDTVQYV